MAHPASDSFHCDRLDSGKNRLTNWPILVLSYWRYLTETVDRMPILPFEFSISYELFRRRKPYETLRLNAKLSSIRDVKHRSPNASTLPSARILSLLDYFYVDESEVPF